MRYDAVDQNGVWHNRPQHILDHFGVNQESKGARLLLEASYQLAESRALDDGRTIGDIFNDAMRREKYSTLVYFGCMKRAARPILDATDGELARCGLNLTERTTTGLIRELAKLC